MISRLEVIQRWRSRTGTRLVSFSPPHSEHRFPASLPGRKNVVNQCLEFGSPPPTPTHPPPPPSPPPHVSDAQIHAVEALGFAGSCHGFS